MSEPTLADVIARLDRLEAALYKLIEAVRAGPTRAEPGARPLSAGPALATGVAGPGEPPLIHVAPPLRSVDQAAAPVFHPPVQSAHQATASPESAAPPAPAYDPYGWRTDIDVPGPTGTIQQVLKRVFEAGLMAEPEDTWAIMAKLTHPSQMLGPRALDHFKAFNWHKLRRTAATYLKNGDPATFQIAYTDPSEVTPEVDHVRIFVRAGEKSMPVPIGFARDPTHGNAWRVTMMSL
jgi:hypothetical protein